MEETILSDGFLEDYIQRCQTDSPQEKVGRQKQHESVARELRQIEQRKDGKLDNGFSGRFVANARSIPSLRKRRG